MFGSPLTRAIRRGLKPNADLQVEIRSIGDYSIKSRRDAFAIVEALRSVSRQIARSNSTATIEDLPVFCLAALFQDIESVDVPAFEIMATEGIAELIQIYDEMLHLDTEAHISDLLFMLKIFAMYGSKPGSERIIKAVKRPLAPENYMWGPVLQMFSSDHPSVRSILQRIATPIPPGFIAVSLLDVGNVNSLEHQIEPHPFDTKDGISQLRSWICSSDPDEFSYAHSATAALPFLSSGDRDELLNLSMQHADVGVQIEAAWAAAKLGRSEGIDALVRYCHDVSHSERASHYLQELDLAENIPAETQDETFRARATFANWLAHPNELGSPPDEVEVVDSRQLKWPTHDGPTQFWLLKYRAIDKSGLSNDNTNYGLVGSMTWCFFSNNMPMRPPEDCYAIHCTWEMCVNELIEVTEITDADEYAPLLRHLPPDEYDNARIVRVAELSPKLNRDHRLVAIATASHDGNNGWIVLDGNKCTWYSPDDFPEDENDESILRIHLGRSLLGLTAPVDRKAALRNKPAPFPADKLIAGYETLLEELATASIERTASLLARNGLIQKHLEDYLDAIESTPSGDRHTAQQLAFERCLAAAEKLPDAKHPEVYDSFTLFGNQFEAYTTRLAELGEFEKVVRLIQLFDPHWQHNLGFGMLGRAAFVAQDWDLAESYFLKLKEGLDTYFRCDEMSQLATIWHGRGNHDASSKLLIDCLRGTQTTFLESEYFSDREMHADEYRVHRETLQQLFPNATEILQQQELPFDLVP